MNNESLSAQERIKLYTDYLTEEGYRPQVNQEIGGITFKHKGNTLWIVVDENDPGYFTLLFPFWSIDSAQERQKAYVAADRANHTCKVVKVYQNSQNAGVSAAIEQFFEHPDEFRLIFRRALHALYSGVATFAKAMQEGEEH